MHLWKKFVPFTKKSNYSHMNNQQFKQAANMVYLIGIVCALLIYTGKTFGYAQALRIIFYVCGALGLILNLAFYIRAQADSSLLFWFGSLAVYIGFIARFLHQPYYTYILIAGIALSAISFFFDPFKRETEEEDNLLDN